MTLYLLGFTNTLLLSILLGVLATAFMDLWAMVQTKITGQPALNYGLVARWITHFVRTGELFLEKRGGIQQIPPIKDEKTMGMLAHYGIGVSLAIFFVFFFSSADFFLAPSVFYAITFGVITTLIPYCLMQPAFGAGYFASKTPKPNETRLKSLIAHFSYGLGLYIAGFVCRWVVFMFIV